MTLKIFRVLKLWLNYVAFLTRVYINKIYQRCLVGWPHLDHRLKTRSQMTYNNVLLHGPRGNEENNHCLTAAHNTTSNGASPGARMRCMLHAGSQIKMTRLQRSNHVLILNPKFLTTPPLLMSYLHPLD